MNLGDMHSFTLEESELLQCDFCIDLSPHLFKATTSVLRISLVQSTKRAEWADKMILQWMEEILHQLIQLIDGLYPIIYRFSTILLVVDFFHPQCSRATFLAPAQYPPWALFLGQCSGSRAGWHSRAGRWHMMAFYEKYGGFLMVTHKSSIFHPFFWVDFPWKPQFLSSRMGIHPPPRLPVGSRSWLSSPLALLRRSWTERRQNPANRAAERRHSKQIWTKHVGQGIYPQNMAWFIWYVYVPP